MSITGQTGSKSALEKNAGVFLNPDQPLVQVSYFFRSSRCPFAITQHIWCLGSCDIGERHSQTRRKSSVCPRETARSSPFVVICSSLATMETKTHTKIIIRDSSFLSQTLLYLLKEFSRVRVILYSFLYYDSNVLNWLKYKIWRNMLWTRVGRDHVFDCVRCARQVAIKVWHVACRSRKYKAKETFSSWIAHYRRRDSNIKQFLFPSHAHSLLCISRRWGLFERLTGGAAHCTGNRLRESKREIS